MIMMASQITSLRIVYSTICSGADQRKHQSSASLAFVQGIHRWPVNSPHKRPVMQKMFPFDDIIMFTQECSSGPDNWTWKGMTGWSTGAHFTSDLTLDIPFCYHPNCSEVSDMKFCTWHDSCAVTACAKLGSDMMTYNGVTLKTIFHRIRIWMEKLFV